MPTTGAQVRDYWNTHIHDLEISRQPPGSPGFFADLDAYHFEKLHHLLRLVDFNHWRGRPVLDVGCGAGVEVVRFARGGARVVGVDTAEQAAKLTRQNLRHQNASGHVAVADADALPFPAESFDFVYAHGVVQYAASDTRTTGDPGCSCCRRS
jgi:SAM-dependent methyltransferase